MNGGIDRDDDDFPRETNSENVKSAVNFLQVCDHYRNQYEKETGKECDVWLVNDHKKYGYLTAPTWEYVCWLEKKLKNEELATLVMAKGE